MRELKEHVTLQIFKTSCLLSTKLATFGLLICPVPLMLLWVPIAKQPVMRSIWEHDLSNNYTFIYLNDLLNVKAVTQIGGLLIWQISFNVFLPIAFAAYFRLSFISTVKLIAFVLLGMIPFLVFYSTFKASSIVSQILSLVPFALFVFYMRFVLRIKLSIVIIAIKHICILLLGILFVTVVAKFPASDDGSQVTLILIVIPFFREATLLLSRETGFSLMFEARATEKVQKSYFSAISIMFILWTHAAWSLFLRLSMAEIRSPDLHLFVVACSSFLQIPARLGFFNRLQMLITTKCKLKKIPAVHPNSQVPDISESQKKEIRYEFSAMVVLSHLINKYVAICLVPILLLLFNAIKLGVPFGYYGGIPKPFSVEASNFDFPGVVTSSVVQLVAETCVDTFCCVFEGLFKEGMSVEKLIQGNTFGAHPFRLIYVLCAASCCFGHIFTFLFIFLRNAYSLCNDMDICCCASGRGLQHGGLVERYCDKIVANYTDLFISQCGMTVVEAMSPAKLQSSIFKYIPDHL